MWHTYWSKSSFPFYFLSPCSSRPSQGKVRLLWSLPCMSNGRQTNQAEFLGQHFISPGCRRTRVNLNQDSGPDACVPTSQRPDLAHGWPINSKLHALFYTSIDDPWCALARWQDAAAIHARPLAPANLSRRSAAGWSWHDHKHPLAKPHVRRSSSSITCGRSRKLPRQLIEPSAASGRTWTPPGAPQGEAAQ
jgi:hypothetical protein